MAAKPSARELSTTNVILVTLLVSIVVLVGGVLVAKLDPDQTCRVSGANSIEMRIGVPTWPLSSAVDTGGHRENQRGCDRICQLQTGMIATGAKDRSFKDA